MDHYLIWIFLMTIEIFLVGVGTGNPAHITLQAIEQLKSADIIIIPRKGNSKSDLADLRYQICNKILGEECPQLFEFDLPTRKNKKIYPKAVEEWHETIAKIWIDCIEKAQQDLKKSVNSVGLLIWGDPSLYDSSLRIAKRLKPTPQITIIPGITSVQALTAAHKITINQIGKPFMITTGRQLTNFGFPDDIDTAIIMLDGNCSFRTLEQERFYIWWGAYLGMEQELLIEGKLNEMSDVIVETRKNAREMHGWIMDSYMLRREKIVGKIDPK